MFGKTRVANALTRALEADPEIPIMQVLTHNDLAISARNEVDSLMNYFVPANASPDADCPHLAQLLDICFTGTLDGKPVDYTISTNAVNLLASPTSRYYGNFLPRVMKTNIFNEKIAAFMEGRLAKDARTAGYFSRICRSCVLLTQGNWEIAQKVLDFMLDNCHISAYSSYLESLVGDDMNVDLFHVVSQRIAACDKNCAVYIQCLASIGMENDDYSAFVDEQLMRDLLTGLTKAKPNSIAAFRGWNFARHIKEAEQPEWMEKLFDEMSPKFNLDKDTLKGGLSIFGKRWIGKPEVVDQFFQLNVVDTQMNQGFLSAIDQMTDDELREFIRQHRIVERLVQSEAVYFTSEKYKTKSANGFIPKLAQKLLERKVVTGDLSGGKQLFDEHVTRHTMQYERFVKTIIDKYTEDDY